MAFVQSYKMLEIKEKDLKLYYKSSIIQSRGKGKQNTLQRKELRK